MADNVTKEILQYVLDTAQLEAGAQRVKQIEQSIADARQNGQETGGLEGKLTEEAKAHEAVKGKADESRLSLERLLKSKRDLGDAISLLGGEFRGLLGDVGGTIELFMRFGEAAAPLVGILAGVTAGVEAFKSIAESAKRTADDMERARAAQMAMRGEAVSESTSLYDAAAKAGVSLSPQDLEAGLSNISAGTRNPVRPLPRAFLRNREVARVLARRYGLPDDDESLNRALAATGGELPDVNGSASDQERAMNAFMSGGRTPEAGQVFENWRAAHAGQAALEGPFDPNANAKKVAEDAALKQLERAGWDPAEITRVRQMVDDRDLLRGMQRSRDNPMSSPFGVGRLSEEEERAIAEAALIAKRVDEVGARTASGQTVNVHITHNGVNYQNSRDPRNLPFLDPSNNGTPGGGQHAR